MTRLLASLTLALALIGCDGDDSPSQPLDGGPDVPGFGRTCSGSGDCPSNLCFEFGQGGKLCTITCRTDADCPAGSQGRKCNNQGVCRP